MMHGSSRSESRFFDQTVEITFHDVAYLLHAFVDRTGALSIEAEQKDTGARWTGRFSSKTIEDLTTKTGNFKAFSVFLKMMATAMNRSSETVFIDLFTYADLQMLQKRKTGRKLDNQDGRMGKNKRYLILTYIVEFDKVHYPLQLRYEENPNPNTLKKTIRRLRNELETAHNSEGDRNPSLGKLKAEMFRAQQENRRLKMILKQTPAHAGFEDSTSKQHLEQSLEDLKAELVEKNNMIQTLMEGSAEGKAGLARSFFAHQGFTELQQKLADTEEKLKSERELFEKEIVDLAAERDAHEAELRRSAESERSLRLQVRKLKAELRSVTRTRTGGRVSSSYKRRTESSKAKAVSARTPTGSSRAAKTGGSQPSYARSQPAKAGLRGLRDRHVSSSARARSRDRANRDRPWRASRSNSARSSRAGSRAGSRLNSAYNSRNSSRASSRQGSRQGSRTSSRQGSREGSRSNSRSNSRPRSKSRREGKSSSRPGSNRGKSPKFAWGSGSPRGGSRGGTPLSSSQQRKLAKTEAIYGGKLFVDTLASGGESPGGSMDSARARRMNYSNGLRVKSGRSSKGSSKRASPSLKDAFETVNQIAKALPENSRDNGGKGLNQTSSSRSKAKPDPSSDSDFDAQREIAAIDDRINTLQSFLKAAKATTSAMDDY